MIKDIMMRLVAPGIVGLFEPRSLARGNDRVANAEGSRVKDQNEVQNDLLGEEAAEFQ